jgi:LPS export ABC transporter protein LptC
MKKLPFLFILLYISGCSLDYGQGFSAELDEDMPDAVFIKFQHTVVENNQARFRLEADRGESFLSQNIMKLVNAQFTEYSAEEKDKIMAEGTAEFVLFYSETESAEFSGAVRFKSVEEKVTFESSYLLWDGETKVLESRAEAVTTITKDDGSYLTGSGFRSDSKRRSIEFTNYADGLFKDTSTDSSAEPEDFLEE